MPLVCCWSSVILCAVDALAVCTHLCSLAEYLTPLWAHAALCCGAAMNTATVRVSICSVKRLPIAPAATPSISLLLPPRQRSSRAARASAVYVLPGSEAETNRMHISRVAATCDMRELAQHNDNAHHCPALATARSAFRLKMR